MGSGSSAALPHPHRATQSPPHRVDKLGGGILVGDSSSLGGKLHLFLAENFAPRNNESSSVLEGRPTTNATLLMDCEPGTSHILAASANKLERKNTACCSAPRLSIEWRWRGGRFTAIEKTDSFEEREKFLVGGKVELFP